MKTIKTLIIAGVMSLASTTFGQQVDFKSIPGIVTNPTGVVKDSSSNPIHTSAFVAQLWGSVVNNNTATFSLVSGTYNFSAVNSDPNYWGQIFDTGGIGGTATYNVSGAAPNATFFYQIRVWTIANGATFQAASGTAGAQVGASGVTSVTLSGGQVITPNTDNFTSFSLATVVPEPGVLALGLLGGAVLLFRRRK